jgi:hypothetical protein
MGGRRLTPLSQDELICDSEDLAGKDEEDRRINRQRSKTNTLAVSEPPIRFNSRRNAPRLIPGHAILIEKKINQFNAIPQCNLSRFRHWKNGPHGLSYFHIVERRDSFIYSLMFGPVAGHQSLLTYTGGSQSTPSVFIIPYEFQFGGRAGTGKRVRQERTYGHNDGSSGSLHGWECAKVGEFPDVHEPAIAREAKVIPAGIDKLRRCRDIRLGS